MTFMYFDCHKTIFQTSLWICLNMSDSETDFEEIPESDTDEESDDGGSEPEDSDPEDNGDDEEPAELEVTLT